MVVYRPVRSSYSDSIKELKVFRNCDEMFDYIVEFYNMPEVGGYAMSKDDLLIGDYVSDYAFISSERVVLTKRFRCDVFKYPQCIGYCDFNKFRRA